MSCVFSFTSNKYKSYDLFTMYGLFQQCTPNSLDLHILAKRQEKKKIRMPYLKGVALNIQK